MRRVVSKDDFKWTNSLMRKPQGSESPKPTVNPDGDCWVCEEYEARGNQVVAACDSEDFLEGWRLFKPLEEAPDLFLKFSRLSQERDFAQAALSFSRKYGLPTGTTGGLYSERRPKRLSFRRFFQESKRAWAIVALYESVLDSDEALARKLLTAYQDDNDVFRNAFVVLTRDKQEGTIPESALQCALYATVFAVEDVVNRLCRQDVVLHFGDGPKPDPSCVKQVWSFENLLGAMYLQMHWLLVAGSDLVRCEHCGRVISLARPHPEGRKRRRDKRFCDDACRQARHRSKKQA